MNSDHKIATPEIRLASVAVLEGIFRVDPTTQREKHRKETIRRAVDCATCYIATSKEVAGYAILEYTFLKWALFPFWLFTRIDREAVWGLD